MLNKDEILGIDKNSGFAARVLMFSLPPGIIFFIFGALGLLPISLSLISYICLLFFYSVLLMPLSTELQRIKKYIKSLSAGNMEAIEIENMSEKETRELTEAINSMHKFWAEKAEMLENRTLSDAAVLDTLPEPLLMVNKEGIIIGANRSVRQLFNQELSNHPINTIISDTLFLKNLERVLTLNTRHEDMRLTLNNLKDKPKFHISMTTLPWFAKGDIVVVISFYDLYKMLQFEQMQRDFVANASHELRTPLSIISGFIETLQTTAKNDEKARDKFLHVIGEQTNYMTSLIEDLLSLSKIEMTVDILPTEKIGINNLIREINTALSLKIKEHSLKIESHLARLPQIIADEHQIKQVLQNLLDNAVKYASPDTSITITTQKVDKIPPHRSYEVATAQAVAISITNKGITITKENLERLTERFYRLQEHKNRNIKGTGLGLSIAAEIIKRHKGNMLISSENGETTFTVYLPLTL